MVTPQEDLTKNNIISKDDYVKGIMSGIKQVADVIRETYGGAGKNVIVQSNLYPYHRVTNDAQTIVQAIQVKGFAEKVAVNFLKELCDKQDKLLGNGRKTTILILDKILEEGYKYEGDKNELKRELDALIPVIESEIDLQTKQITVDEVGDVATTASENKETGALLQKIYQKIGKNGIVQVQGSGTYETSYKETNGIRFDMTGMYSPDMVHEENIPKEKQTKAIYEKPIILVTRMKITNDDDLDPLLVEMAANGQKDLVIFTHGMDSNVASKLVNLHKSGRYNILIIKNTSIWRDFVYEDFGKCVGATVIDEITGKNFKNLNLQDLGTCDRIEVDENETIIIGNKDISRHIETLQVRGDDDSKLRLEWLSNKSAIVKLGSNSETDLSLKLLKFKDAIRSSELALKYGVTRGGGITLANLTKNLLNTEAGRILGEALKAPYIQIAKNSGFMGDMFTSDEIPENIVDASMTTKRAVRHAVGIASTILTSSAIVHLIPPTPEEIQYAIATNQNRAF